MCVYIYIHTHTHTHTQTHTGCPGGNVSDFGRMFLNPLNAELNPIFHLLLLFGAQHILHVSRIRAKLKHTDITKNTYIRSWTVTEIMAREKCGLLAVLSTVPGSRDVLSVHCACPSFSLHSAQARSRWDCTYKVLGTLRTTTTFVRVFMYFNWMALCHSDVNYMLSTDIHITETTYSCQF